MTKNHYFNVESIALRLKNKFKDILSKLPYTDNIEKYLKDKRIKNEEKKEILQLHNQWIDIMVNSKALNEFSQTYGLNYTTKTIYGFRSEVFLTSGLDFVQLKDLKEKIQDGLGCLITLNRLGRTRVVMIDFIFSLQETLAFKIVRPLKNKDYNERVLYIGNDYSGEPIFCDMTTLPHILISGGTRSGKSKMMDVIISNLVANFSSDVVEINLFQPAKSDLEQYSDLEHCNVFADSLKSIRDGLTYIMEIMNERTLKIKPMHKSFNGDNYVDYNKLNPKDKIKTCYCAFDEMSTLYETSTGEPKFIKDMKSIINMMIRRIAQYGAALGVFLISSLQRPTKDNLDPFVKSQSTIIISFRQNNATSSLVAFDDAEIALKLQPREFAYRIGNVESYGLVPWINSNDVKNSIYKYIIPGSQERKQKLRNDLNNRISELLLAKEKETRDPKSKAKPKTAQELMNERVLSICYSLDDTYELPSAYVDRIVDDDKTKDLDVDKVKRRIVS